MFAILITLTICSGDPEWCRPAEYRIQVETQPALFCVYGVSKYVAEVQLQAGERIARMECEAL